MSGKKTNEILEEQRRAREEFLKLKKMQHGEMKAPPKPSEVAILPKTPKEKIANFWFQYKWYVTALTALAVVVAVLVAQCASRVSYDLQIVYFTYQAAIDEQTGEVAAYFEDLAEDINGDGEVHVQVVNCSFEKESGNSQYGYTMMTKLQAMLAGDESAMLFITDAGSYAYLNQFSEGGLFEGEPVALDKEFYAATKSETLGELPEGLQISCRRVTGTVIEKKKNVQAIYQEAQRLLKQLKT